MALSFFRFGGESSLPPTAVNAHRWALLSKDKFSSAFASNGCTLFSLVLDDSPTYTVPAGAEVTVNLTNHGAAPHVFDILKLGEHVNSTFQPTDKEKILWGLSVSAGNTKSGTFTAPTEPGEYEIICTVPGHVQMGMTATLIVE